MQETEGEPGKRSSSMPHHACAAFLDYISPSWSLWTLNVYGFFCLGSRYKVKKLGFNKHTRIDTFRRLMSSSKELDSNGTATLQNSFEVSIWWSRNLSLRGKQDAAVAGKTREALEMCCLWIETFNKFHCPSVLHCAFPEPPPIIIRPQDYLLECQQLQPVGAELNKAACLGNWPWQAQWPLITQSSAGWSVSLKHGLYCVAS